MEGAKDWELRYPDPFESLDGPTRRAITWTVANHAQEVGIEPDRETLADLIAAVTGTITPEEYNRRSDDWAARRSHRPRPR
ncbi:alpha-mannosidase [Nocardia abscessus]|uniref:alpha-mannosidase n=1 Tax=Nocardia abscessus TaxID=120957 RepID=UPI0018934F87|nr:alpha-mannosidase [Nocardia abscessus]MBF6341625.1 alpha-mannosidase [Nocardia abscessus]